MVQLLMFNVPGETSAYSVKTIGNKISLMLLTLVITIGTSGVKCYR